MKLGLAVEGPSFSFRLRQKKRQLVEVVLLVYYSSVSRLNEGALPLTVLLAAFESISFAAVSVASMPRIPHCLCTLILLCESKISV